MLYTEKYCKDIGITFKLELPNENSFDRNMIVSYNGFSTNSVLSANAVEDLKANAFAAPYIIHAIVESFMKEYEGNRRLLLNKKLKKLKKLKSDD